MSTDGPAIDVLMDRETGGLASVCAFCVPFAGLYVQWRENMYDFVCDLVLQFGESARASRP